jgi:hypothetical protein
MQPTNMQFAFVHSSNRVDGRARSEMCRVSRETCPV